MNTRWKQLLTHSFRSRGAQDHAYSSIVASGQNACTLHYINNNSSLKASDLLLIDAGAEVENYAADITRTYAVGKPTKRQQAVHQVVIEIQQFALELLKPGVLLKEYQQAVEHLVGKKLRQLGLIKSGGTKAIRQYCPHSISHFLGLDVHDAGDYGLPVQPGMVLTVEPGIYIPEEGIGVRIEDDVLVTKTGNKVLSSSLPASLL